MGIGRIEGEIHRLKCELTRLEDSMRRYPRMIETAREERPQRVLGLTMMQRAENDRRLMIEQAIRDCQADRRKTAPGWFSGPYSVPVGFWISESTP